jgi:hypothetical protein
VVSQWLTDFFFRWSSLSNNPILLFLCDFFLKSVIIFQSYCILYIDLFLHWFIAYHYIWSSEDGISFDIVICNNIYFIFLNLCAGLMTGVQFPSGKQTFRFVIASRLMLEYTARRWPLISIQCRVKNTRSHFFTPASGFMALCSINHTDSIYILISHTITWKENILVLIFVFYFIIPAHCWDVKYGTETVQATLTRRYLCMESTG